MQERQKITGEIEISSTILKEVQKLVGNTSDLKKKAEEFLKETITEFLEVILAGAIFLNASDIHIEPEEKQAKIRLRIDGLLQDIITLDNETRKPLVSRIKLLSKVKLNIIDKPQDGRFSILIGGSVIEIRASTIPAEYGESVVLRILNPKNLIEIESLGLRKDLLAIFKKEIKRPNGTIIITGPTGSGKTTTLYAILKGIRSPENKIITIEDPIEYHLEGISQTQVNPKRGYDFASGLRSIVRQDPDVILVGEIRDSETADIGLQAALTGHLVLTTLHTNDAAGAVPRLINLGAKPVNIGPAINIVVAQRLLRKICGKCAEFVPISSEILKEIKKELKNISKELKKNINFSSLIKAETKIPQVKGCQGCNFTGYKGRIGVYEFFLIDAEMEKLISTSPSIVFLKELAIKKGMTTMRQDGLIKVLKGITTIEEVEKTIG